MQIVTHKGTVKESLHFLDVLQFLSPFYERQLS